MELLLWLFALVAIAGCIEMGISFTREVVWILGPPRAILFFLGLMLALLAAITLS